MHHFDSARNQFFRAIAAPLIWMPQFAMAIEAWRVRCGPHIGQWMAAVGEFEALCSLACFAYERPAAVFPELRGKELDGSDPVFEAVGLAHPLIPPGESIAQRCLARRRDALVDRQRIEHVRQEHSAARHRAQRRSGVGRRAGDRGELARSPASISALRCAPTTP